MSNNQTAALGARKFDTRRMVTMAMLSAMGIVMGAFFEFPIIPTAPFLLYSPADIPVLVGTMIYGPIPGLIMTAIVSVLQSLTRGSGGPIGCIMHLAATGAMTLVIGFIYRGSRQTLSRAVIALSAGTATMTAVMVGMNLLLTPLFMGVDLQVVIGMLIPAVIPFNVVKAGLNSVVTFIVFRYVEKIALR